MIIGEPVLPADIDAGTDLINRTLLSRLLNDGNTFDKPLYPISKDRLQLSFTIKDGTVLNYGFVYKKGKWEECEFDYFEWFTKHDEIKEGKIRNALDTKSK